MKKASDMFKKCILLAGIKGNLWSFLLIYQIMFTFFISHQNSLYLTTAFNAFLSS